ncbi:MAG: hypothetical protein GY754_35135 [bacterium]|nr:hypothetical protein [bacterium]
MRRVILLFLLVALLPLATCKSRPIAYDFDYRPILKKEFKSQSNAGKAFLLTNEKSIEIHGDVSRDQDASFFYYSSNKERGNYDIYLRDMHNIATARITSHPAKDTSPVISPNGSYLAFVTNREDPEGDIYVVDIDAEEILDKVKSSASELPSLDEEAKNITLFQDPVTKTILIQKDASPSWSPDSNRIAYSSKKEGVENIWIMNRNGGDKKQVTKKGGSFPSFSPDGKKIVFVSYRDEKSNGEIYTVNIETSAERRITNSPSIKLYPSYMETKNEIIYSAIEWDTNGNGTVDLDDRSVLYYRNISKNFEYPLTLHSESSFAGKWIPVLKKKTPWTGIIVYSNQVGDNINVAFLPDTGIIPKRQRPQMQLDLAEKYLTDYNDRERHLLALEMIYYFSSRKNDKLSQVYATKGLVKAALAHKKYKNPEKSQKLLLLLEKYSKSKSLYSTSAYEYLKAKLNGNSGIPVLEQTLNDLSEKKDKKNKFFTTFLMEDLADEYRLTGKKGKAIVLYKQIIDTDKKYKRKIETHYKYYTLSERKLKDTLSPSFLLVYKSTNYLLKGRVEKHFLDIVRNEKNHAKKTSILNSMMEKYKENKRLTGLFLYASGRSYAKIKNTKKAKEYLLKANRKISKGVKLYYMTNMLLGDIFFNEKDFSKAKDYYFNAAMVYLAKYKDKVRLSKKYKWLIDYYEKYGEREELSGNYKEATSLYKNYVTLLNLNKLKNMFKKTSAEYGPRSQVLYIDSYLKGGGDINKLEKEYSWESSAIIRARIDFNKSYIYGAAYFYTQKALIQEKKSVPSLVGGSIGIDGLLENFKQSMEFIEWAIFLDESFVEPFILKSWIYQYVDLKKKEGQRKLDYKISKYFPTYLWERNIDILERALVANNEGTHPENEGNIHLNIANNYFLLLNYPRAIRHYKEAREYKKNYGSKREEAFFYYHMGYCFWQIGELDDAKEEMRKALNIYESLATGRNLRRYKNQLYLLYKYFALFNRSEEKYTEAINWYQKILDFASRNRVSIDRGRYLQEIAFCYKELGNIDAATSYLNRAYRLLQEYPDDERKYKMDIRLFEFISFKFFNLGEDSAVIGENKIFTSLDTRSKKLLSLSLLEDIYWDKGSYIKATNYLKLKIKVLEERDSQVDKDALLIALNNLGYYYFRARNFTEAKKAFDEAWEYGLDENEKNLDGIFTSIMNLSNLYAFILENNRALLKNPLKEINKITDKVTKYRETYEKAKYKSALDELEDKKEAKKEKVTEKDKQDLEKSIADEAIEKYYKIDIALGVLTFYKAELLFDKEYKAKNADVDSAFNLYKENRDLFDQYAAALKRFRDALKISEESNNKRLTVKLKINTGACYARMQALEKAYTSFLDAKTLAEENRFYDLQLELYNKLGSFVARYGKTLEGENYLFIAKEYYGKGIAMVEELPLVYAGSINKVRALYDNYTEILITAGNRREALLVSEKKYNTSRLMLISLSSPEFNREEDREDYQAYIAKVRTIDRMQGKISALLGSGEGAESKKFKGLNTDLAKKKEELKKFISSIKTDRPLFASNLAVTKPAIPANADSVIYKFFKAGKNIYAWKIENGKVEFKTLPAPGERSWSSILSEYMKITYSGSKSRRIILNESLLELIKQQTKKGLANLEKEAAMPPFMYVPSLDRIGYYTGTRTITLNRICNTGKGVKKYITNTAATVDEGKTENVDFRVYSVIIDNAENKMIEPSYIFNTKIQPSLVIKNLEKLDIDYITLFMESSLYAGIQTVFFAEDISQESIGEIINISEEEGFSYAQTGTKIPEKILGIGNRGMGQETRIKQFAAARKQEYALFKKDLFSGKFSDARTHLGRWNSLQPKEPEAGIEKDTALFNYRYELARLEMLEENYTEALALVETTLKETSPATKQHDRFSLLKIYLHLYMGDIKNASSAMEKDKTGRLQEYFDYTVFQALIKLSTEESGGVAALFADTTESKKETREDTDEETTEEIVEEEAVAVEKEIKSKKQILNSNRLRLLYAEYAALYGNKKQAAAIMKTWTKNYPVTSRELLKASILRGSFKLDGKKISGTTKRINSIIALSEETRSSQLKTQTLLLVAKEARYDSISPYPLLIAAGYFKKKNIIHEAIPFLANISFSNIDKGSQWLDTINLFSELINLYLLDDRYKEALVISNLILNNEKLKNIPTVQSRAAYMNGLILTKPGEDKEAYKKAYKILSKSEKLVPAPNDLRERTGDDLYEKYQLLLMETETAIGDYSKARERGVKLSAQRTLKNEYRYVLKLLLARIELNRILKIKNPTRKEGEKFEKLFKETLAILDSSPDVLNRFNKIELIEESLDGYINYTFQTKRQLDALVYAEVKKLFFTRSGFPGSTGKPLSPAVINKFKSLGKKRSPAMVPLLNSFPSLITRTSIESFPVQVLLKKIPKNGLLVYTIRNGNNIIIWLLDQDTVKNPKINRRRFLIIKDGYTKAEAIIDEYRDTISKFSSTIGVSKKLSQLFRPIQKELKKKKLLIFVTDSSMEEVPFEIMGEKEMLEESHQVVYLSSAILGIKGLVKGNTTVNILGDSGKKAYKYVESIALEESGIPLRTSATPETGGGIEIDHIHFPVFYNKMNKELYLGEKLYKDHIKTPHYIYLPSVDFSGVGYNDFSIYNSLKNVKGVIINDADIHDLNNAIFVSTFYRELRKGKGLFKAFEAAKYSIRKKKAYRHPAYWAGIRLYLNGL